LAWRGAAGVSTGAGSPASVARTYEDAIAAKDGDRLCATFVPKLRQVLEEQALERAAGSSGGQHFNCGAYFHAFFVYPHENVDRSFVAGKVLAVGHAQRTTRHGVVYSKVPARLRIQFIYTGYSIRGGKSGERGAATVHDTVWLSRAKDGTWGVVKPSLALLAAGNPDTLYDRYSVARANAAPPDPDYSMNRAERTAWEAADYRASFRRNIKHAPLRCTGKSVSVSDPVADGFNYPTGSSLEPAAAPGANDITRVKVQAAGGHLCVTVTFRRKPQGALHLGFTPRSRRAVFGEFVVERVAGRGVRAGGLTVSYKYFRGGERLIRARVGEISLYGRTIAFVADATKENSPINSVPSDLEWRVDLGSRAGSDRAPNAPAGHDTEIRQSDGHTVASG